MSLQTAPPESQIRTITVVGALDAAKAQDLRAEITDALATGVSRVIVDLGDTSFIDSAGLAALAWGMKGCRGNSGDLRIVPTRHDAPARVFQLTRFDQVFRSGSSVDELVDAW